MCSTKCTRPRTTTWKGSTKAFWGHVGYTVTNAARALVMGLTGSHFVKVPDAVAPETRRYYQQLARFSAAFAFLADISMGSMGGALKRWRNSPHGSATSSR